MWAKEIAYGDNRKGHFDLGFYVPKRTKMNSDGMYEDRWAKVEDWDTLLQAYELSFRVDFCRLAVLMSTGDKYILAFQQVC